MRKSKNYLQVLTFFVVFTFLLSTLVLARNASAAETPAPGSDKSVSSGESASQEELAQILAPIALYPDTLLAQMFMAATYPLEIVEAARFVKENSSLKEDALDKALKEQEWDVSVKSLCHFPTVLASMSDNLDATKRLGDYFLDDQKAVMDMVQTLRAKAQEEGNLKTTEEQKVVVEEKIIVIESVNPQVVYVPSYSCTYVYGPWWYPHYPPYVWYPPPPRYGFGVGVAVGIGIGAWCRPNWHRGDIDININRTTNFNKNVNIGGGGKGQAWKHNSKHRQGVAYNNKSTRKNFGQSDRAAKKRDLGRGRTSQGLDRKTRDSIKQQGLKSNVRQSGNRKQNRSASQKASRPATSQRRDVSGRRPSSTKRSQPQRSSAFNSSGSGNRASRMSQRGSASRNRSINRSGGGRSRGGGRRRR
ncbi:MAG: DUF3300 domain-containing protein [Pseudomonadota bacterium]|nr:DUF3300 domain-containing protein [Pseudomonadota bacterium]